MRATRSFNALVGAITLSASPLVLAGCADPNQTPKSALSDLHACPDGSDLVGALAHFTPDSADSEGLLIEGGYDIWGFTSSGEFRPLTDDRQHPRSAIAPDGKAVYVQRAAGAEESPAGQAPDLIERIDLLTGASKRLVALHNVLDISISDDGRFVAVAHSSAPDPKTLAATYGVTVLDATQEATPRAIPLPVDPIKPGLLGAIVYQVSISPNGAQLLYSLTQPVDDVSVISSIHLFDIETGADDTLVGPTDPEDATAAADLAWSADGKTMIIEQDVADTEADLETPRRYETTFIDVGTRESTTTQGFSSSIALANPSGGLILGLSQGADDVSTMRSWSREGRVQDELPLKFSATNISVASCSFS